VAMAILLASLPDPGVDAAAGGDSLRSAPLFPPPPPPPVLWVASPAIVVVRVMRVRRNALEVFQAFDHVPRMFELIFGEMSIE
jgi:hypothetical protein